jgi:hypothetical protein
MAKITIDPQSTYNQTPIITGTVEFQRFDNQGNPKETIEIILNYTRYTLFDGNLGLNEYNYPFIWKLHLTAPLYPGTYDIEANVIDLTTNTIIASDDTKNELVINRITNPYAYPKPKDLSLFQKFQLVNALMNSMDKLFGGKNGIAPVPSVHPVADDQSSTTEMGRGKEERNQHPVPKSKDKTAKPNKATKPPKQNFNATDPGGEPASTASKSQIAALAEASKGGAVDDAGNNVDVPGPQPTIIQGADLADQPGGDNPPASQDVDEGLRSAEEKQQTAAEVAEAGQANVITPEASSVSQEEIDKANEAVRAAPDEAKSYQIDEFTGAAATTPEQTDAALRNIAMQQNFDEKAVQDTVYDAYKAPEGTGNESNMPSNDARDQAFARAAGAQPGQTVTVGGRTVVVR